MPIDVFDSLQRYNVVWNSPSRDVPGSMPLGNGDLGVNLWVEEGGDLLLLIGKTDAWDENATNLKLGRVRVSLKPNPFGGGEQVLFKQVLQLRSGEVSILAGEEGSRVWLRIWVDAHQPVIRVEMLGAKTEMTATLEMWRTEGRVIKTQTGDLFRNLNGPDPHPTIVSADHVLSRGAAGAGGAGGAGRVVWCHHNESRAIDGFEINMKLQGLGGFIERMSHPLRGRTFGAAMEGEGMVSVDATTLRSARPQRRHVLSIHALTLHPATIEQWQEELERTIIRDNETPLEVARRKHERWWEEFWQRSWIFVTATDPAEAERVFHITQGYLLQRFMNACGGRGAGTGGPIKFNGSIFTVGKAEDPDFRRWGGPGFWFQNQRLIYWPMLAAGDFDLLRPWYQMYRDMLPLQRHRTEKYFHHGGAHYPETIMFWGAEVSAHYGWTPFEQRARPEAECSYVAYYWTCGIELVLMLWTSYRMAMDEGFAREMLLPIADAVTEFFDLHYRRDASRKIRFEPAQSLETWHEAVNPLPEIAGLRYVLPKLLELPEGITTDAQRSRWRRMLSELPPIPTGVKDGVAVILPAERFDKKKNTENPELYAVFPFRLFGVGKPNLELARDTFAARLHQSHDCWSQDDVQLAYLGLVEQAKDYLGKRASPASHSESRFPAFWNAFHDWIPDMDHGGVLQLALQAMLIQTEGNEIRLLPAWPAEWDVAFKLHAPANTVVEGEVRAGKFVELHLTPEHRRADVITETLAG